MTDQHVEVGRFYTLARRFPILVGKLDAGTKIPFGPYTMPQIIGTALVIYVLMQTWTWWTQLPTAAALLIGVGLPVGTAIGLRHLPLTGRGFLSMALSVGDLLMSSSGGRIGGRVVTLRRPHQTRGRILVPSAPVVALEREPIEETEVIASTVEPELVGPTTTTVLEPTAQTVGERPVTGVSKLLAAAVREPAESEGN